MALILVSPPAGEPVTLAEAKRDMRIDDDFTEHDLLIEANITAAREQFERVCNRAFIGQQWEMTAARFPLPGESIVLPFSPLISIDSVAWQDTAGNWNLLEEEVGYFIDASEPPKIVAHSWPVTRGTPGSVKITFTAGYGAADDVPEGIKNAIRMFCKAEFEASFQASSGSEYERRMAAVTALITPFRVFQFV